MALNQPVVRQAASQRCLSLQQCTLGCLKFIPLILNRFIFKFSNNVPIQILYETIGKRISAKAKDFQIHQCKISYRMNAIN